ncbi:MAG: hypothetical protein ABSG05_02135 [Candidatus Pacearchaeota archaeon]|jgi:hypothetical protein
MANKKDESGLAIPAGLFIGMGIGFMTNDLVPWIFIGLGGGFLGMLISKLVKK